MERKLANLFDHQRFLQNARLASIINDVENRYAGALDDDNLEMVNAAGVNIIILHETQSKDEDDAYVDKQKRTFR